jgi:glycosyltransferase involved in cell wall biosynthesis
MCKVSHRIVILTEIIAPYRIPVFNGLAKYPGVDLHVIFLAENDPTVRQWLVYKDEIHFPYQVLASWRKRLGKYNLLVNWSLRAALRRLSPDTIICGGYNYIASWTAMAWAARNHVQFLLWVESNAMDQRAGLPWVEFFKRAFLNRCNRFIVPGKSSLEYLRSYAIPDSRIYTAPNAVDSEFFLQRAAGVRASAEANRKNLKLPARFLLFAGRLVREKGVFDLLDAYRALSPELRASLALVFAGDGGARQQLQETASSISPGLVYFPGFLQREQLASYYALAEALILPTHTDPWGLVVNEAMACGLPIIASSAAGCVADLVADGWNGRVIAPGDVVQLGAAMSSLAADDELRKVMGIRSAERILNYSPQACAAGLAEACLETDGMRDSRRETSARQG